MSLLTSASTIAFPVALRADETLESLFPRLRGMEGEPGSLLIRQQERGDALARGGLAPWQARRIERHIAENAHQTIRVGELAALVRLSVSHFSRAFQVSFGDSPHAALNRYRIERVKMLMTFTVLPLSEIAVACGFADQSHLTRQFRRHVAASPGQWRREQRAELPAIAAIADR
jgi:AraC family transcriptional regulator